ncbi:class I SAM-dependent methyltransferase [Galbibacter mesophilus]|uniref:class I SAM-dependent methyltransferase n=1 Tax=Galbibacter mesophilus TaxID=379069 RepID=UPI00191CACDD|nr:class I SAM-dependent methyltransferase [Galbibacter mesophilus]MCM5662743.1 class I SAM-dependent methyltransferase [Galbibacter mesophilus]
MEDNKLKEIEAQLRCPSGSGGVDMGNEMYRSNLGMIAKAIEAVSPEKDDTILELGHGNARHLSFLFSMQKAVKYFGLDISETMHHEALKNSKEFNEATSFKLYDGGELPCKDALFDKIFTVNTIYFWENPLGMLKELRRVLKPSGQLAIAFAQQEFMEKLPFVGKSFTLYSTTSLKELIQKSPFEIKNILEESETIKSKTGEIFTRNYAVFLLN